VNIVVATPILSLNTPRDGIGSVVEQCLACKARLPKTACALVLTIDASGDGLFQVFYEPTQRTQALPKLVETLSVLGERRGASGLSASPALVD
jgi:hypothetical protein